jgi:hypothetical protein
MFGMRVESAGVFDGVISCGLKGVVNSASEDPRKRGEKCRMEESKRGKRPK